MPKTKTGKSPRKEKKEEPQEFEVECILLSTDAEDTEDKHFYIKWKGYSMADCTWEPYEHLEHMLKEVKEFEADIRSTIGAKYLKIRPPVKLSLTPLRIAKERDEKKGIEYCIEWEDFPITTWEPSTTKSKEIQKLIKEYKQSKKKTRSASQDKKEASDKASGSSSVESDSNKKKRKRAEEAAESETTKEKKSGESSPKKQKVTSSPKAAEKAKTNKKGDKKEDLNLDSSDNDVEYVEREGVASSSSSSSTSTLDQAKKRRHRKLDFAALPDIEMKPAVSTSEEPIPYNLNERATVEKIIFTQAEGMRVKLKYEKERPNSPALPLDVVRRTHPQELLDYFMARTVTKKAPISSTNPVSDMTPPAAPTQNQPSSPQPSNGNKNEEATKENDKPQENLASGEPSA